jgi:outer membrane protein OmpA-like peptidoglycan-associated protein
LGRSDWCVSGAALGAATGDNKKDRRERALRGAAIGGVVGGGVGAYMDVQEKKLREKLQGSGVGVLKMLMALLIWLCQVILLSQQVKADIRGDFFETLNSVALVLKEYNKTSITVSGHTDSVGKDDLNMKLSQDRANSVAQYLVESRCRW